MGRERQDRGGGGGGGRRGGWRRGGLDATRRRGGGGDAEDEPRRRVTGKAKASTAAPAPAKKRANLNPSYPSSDESEAGHKERSAAVVHTHTASCKHCVVHSDMHHVMR